MKRDRRRAQRAAEGDAADEQAHVRERVQEPRPRAGRREDARGLRAEGAPHRRRADLAAPRELHREHRRRHGRRRARADGRSPPAGARASSGSRSSARSSSSATSSCRRWASCRVGRPPAEGEVSPWPASERPACARASSGSTRCAAAAPRLAGAWRWLPSGRSLAVGPRRSSRSPEGAYAARARDVDLRAFSRIDVRGAPPALARAHPLGARAARGYEPPLVRPCAPPTGGWPASPRSRASGTTATSRTRCTCQVAVEQPVAVLRRATDGMARRPRPGASSARSAPGAYPSLPRIWLAAETAASPSAPRSRPVMRRSWPRRSRRAACCPVRVLAVRDDGDRPARAAGPGRPRAPARRHEQPAAEARRRGRDPARWRTRATST